MTSCARTRWPEIIFWGGMATAVSLLPYPFVRGAGAASSLFMVAYETFKHANPTSPLALSRTWKHVTGGVLVAGVTGGLTVLAPSTSNQMIQGLGLLAFGLGSLSTVVIACGNDVFRGDYSHAPINDLEVGVVGA